MPRKSFGRSTAVLLAGLLAFALTGALVGGCTKAPEEAEPTPSPEPAQAPAPSSAPPPAAAPAASMARFSGTIDASGYHPPAGASVLWQRPGFPTVTKRLNSGISWNGQNAGDDAGYFGRYAEGDTSVRGAQIAAIGSEQKGGEASSILAVLLGRPPSNQELFDFAISNSPGSPMNCASWVAIIGAPRDGCQDTSGGGGGDDRLRARPNTPPGCCGRDQSQWCIVNDPVRDARRRPGEHWIEPVRDPVRGRMACNMIKAEGGTPPVTPPPVTPPPVTPPPVTPPPVTPPPVTPPPQTRDTCYLVRVPPVGDATLTKVACPPQ
ncbi:MAG TPA: hypothetical protein VN493_04375 [Thermoanaerobaculia bacterium]|nr:hypothetical protein [Thermoanaerobaculia bacterium]